MAGITVSPEQAQHYVDTYRNTYDYVKNSWYQGTKALEAISYKRNASIWNQGFASVSQQGLMFPSGIHMQYPQLKLSENDEGRLEWSYQGRHSREKVYGAKVFQAYTQGLARCVMADQMIKLSKLYRIVLTIHDAVYIVAKVGEAEHCLATTLEIMRTAPSYMPDLVLDAEGGFNNKLSEV